MEFNPSKETIDLVCRKFGYTPSIQVATGVAVNDKTVTVEKEISKDDFFYNYYSQLMDGDALTQKNKEVKEGVMIPDVTIERQPAKTPQLSQEEIDGAVEAANQNNKR